MELRNPLRTAAVLFDGQADGQWTLPDPVIAARDALVRVQKLQGELPPHPPEHPHDVRARLAYVIATGGDIDPQPVLDAQRNVDEYQERVALTRQALEMAGNNLGTVLLDHSRELISSHLMPAFKELVDRLRRDFAATAHIDGQTPPAVVLSQSKLVRDALIRIDGNVSRYRLIRQAFNIVRRISQTESQDNRGLFIEVRNTEQLWPELTRNGYAPSATPWPTDDTRATLAWLFAHGADLWTPTPEQQDARYLEVFGEKLRKAQLGRSQLNGLRSLGEGATGGTGPMPERTAAVHGRLFGTAAGVPVNGGAVTE